MKVRTTNRLVLLWTALMGMGFGISLVFTVASHEMWAGGVYREIPLHIYGIYGAIGFFTGIFINRLAVYTVRAEMDYQDGEE